MHKILDFLLPYGMHYEPLLDPPLQSLPHHRSSTHPHSAVAAVPGLVSPTSSSPAAKALNPVSLFLSGRCLRARCRASRARGTTRRCSCPAATWCAARRCCGSRGRRRGPSSAPTARRRPRPWTAGRCSSENHCTALCSTALLPWTAGRCSFEPHRCTVLWPGDGTGGIGYSKHPACSVRGGGIIAAPVDCRPVQF